MRFPLFISHIAGCPIHVLELLLRFGLDPNAHDHTGTSLMHEVQLMYSAKLLLQHGANVNIKNELLRTPLFYAIDRPELVEFLLEHGADPLTKDKDGFTPFLHMCRVYLQRTALSPHLHLNSIRTLIQHCVANGLCWMSDHPFFSTVKKEADPALLHLMEDQLQDHRQAKLLTVEMAASTLSTQLPPELSNLVLAFILDSLESEGSKACPL
jgi:hypothetical protein